MVEHWWTSHLYGLYSLFNFEHFRCAFKPFKIVLKKHSMCQHQRDRSINSFEVSKRLELKRIKIESNQIAVCTVNSTVWSVQLELWSLEIELSSVWKALQNSNFFFFEWKTCFLKQKTEILIQFWFIDLISHTKTKMSTLNWNMHTGTRCKGGKNHKMK